jgi:hypothetical protein
MTSALLRSTLLLVSLTLLAKDPIEWKRGTLLKIDIGTQPKVVGVNGIVGTQVWHVFTYSVEGGDRIYEGQEESAKPKAKPIQIEVNGPVDYALDKDHLYLKDSEGKIHTVQLIRTTRKE